MTLDPNQQAELAHLLLWMQDSPGFQKYAKWKANHRATKDPLYWGWLPLALSNALSKGTGTTSAPKKST